ncbi:Undecaprenyl pyrophosphate synthetase [Ferrimonas balearica DSM 9799]|uniref:Ditrans,polycis-undecaprenyl-diphosphate synthase ((2E,6E)-farnesyl-diphosphate specific) n=1 Tax=Ferrimonas balearica (strain DSM 9799 / CCM 4581 / KCTC 23876 / PAT) TaxID=550540 RepID=E1SU18_FERBD|nr:polyprenyl diphosphate synthase [Ferrimonas balearica]ADN75165.1 Undecaprenyl pyrophosphate synthetase [Ferrimonas balearica DSM 9799]MBW3138061.1 di-trans,poly-cis-decaprenylcistransferase [Ferrimonas balearica]MBW3164372.1 di-trans,poly-cis-decaprenylcistransferase [Ferrimonas balearica]MBY5978828.1 di-trans,poly-cis-decaprenylcistransferase [Ferrimonas balearica]MBY6105139.1 di-trans,poly-cis-decaprenylcistransferase [Ferrimonas balearica]
MTQPDPQPISVSTPRHIAIIMDGNGRWAEAQGQPRVMGHRAGVKSVRNVVALCRERQVESLTLFAFSSENWHRPEREVKLLMRLFTTVLRREVKLLKKNDVRLKIIGDVSGFDEKLQARILQAEADTAECTGMVLNIAANYGGRWDVVNAARKLTELALQGEIAVSDIDEALLDRFTSLSDQAEVDLLIRTGGEQRISNFVLWQCAYSELFFSDTLWPDFGEAALQEALDAFACRQRRFGLTSAQVAPVA